MSNYPDSINPGDPNGPWNQLDHENRYFYVNVDIKVLANSHSEAVAEAMYVISKQFEATVCDVYEEGE